MTKHSKTMTATIVSIAGITLTILILVVKATTDYASVKADVKHIITSARSDKVEQKEFRKAIRSDIRAIKNSMYFRQARIKVPAKY